MALLCRHLPVIYRADHQRLDESAGAGDGDGKEHNRCTPLVAATGRVVRRVGTGECQRFRAGSSCTLDGLCRRRGGQLQQRLQQEQDPQAQRVLEWLQAHPDVPTPLPVSVWIAADGRISKLEFDSLGDTQVDAALRATLQSAPLQAAPPADMRQPLRLGLVLTQ